MLVAIVFSAQRLMMQKNNTLLNIIGLVIYIICTYILFMTLKPFIATYNVYDRYRQRYNPNRDFFSPKRLNDLHRRRRVFIHHRHKQNRFRRSSSTVTEPMHRRRCHNTTLLHMCICIIYYYIIHIRISLFFYSET